LLAEPHIRDSEVSQEVAQVAQVAPRRKSMAGNNVIELNDTNFDNEVTKSDKPVLVDFGATWCGPCKALAPIVEKLADEYAGKFKVCKVDIDEAPTVTAKFGIRGVPTVLVFKNGEKTGQHVGVTNKETLLKMLGA
jgi:thioredoxin 1